MIGRIHSFLVWTSLLLMLTGVALFAGRPQTPVGASGDLPDEDLVVFDGKLSSSWQDWSWANHSLADKAILWSQKPSLRMMPEGFQGVFLHHDGFSTRGYKYLRFKLYGGGDGLQKLTVCVVDMEKKFGKKASIESHVLTGRIPGGKWLEVTVPLEEMNATNKRITGVCFQDATGKKQSVIYLADIRFIAAHRRNADQNFTVRVDMEKPLGEISPLIYGMASPPASHVKELRLKLWRWGGNPNTRYNWEKGNAWNIGRDWQFQNTNYYSKKNTPSGSADSAISENKALGADALITIPTIGWVARDDDVKKKAVGVPKEGGPPVKPGSEAITGYDPTDNRNRVNIRSIPRKSGKFADPPDLTDDVVFQDEWVNHLMHKFGKASEGGVRFYAMDNEPDLWAYTHTDVHPVQPDYAETLHQFLVYADAVKDVDPTAQITGPVSWGWTNYFYSSRDRGTDGYKTASDRKAHGNTPFLAWFLKQVAEHDKRTGRRTLDVLDVHYYPQGNGIYSGKTDPETNKLRLRSTRALWDEDYTDESWVAAPVQLIPRLRGWIRENYPGTKIGLTEWNWGADKTLNGALAIAEVLGTLGRERVDLACYWMYPPANSPGYFAWKMFRNADDRGNGFGDIALKAEVSEPGRVSCFASLDSKTGKPVLLVINKQTEGEAPVTLSLSGKSTVQKAKIFRYSGNNLNGIETLPEVILAGNRINLRVPATSITLLRCE